MNKLMTAAAAALLLGGAAYLATRKPAPPAASAKAGAVKYQCPMHPQIVRDEPGDCPICHMKLDKVVMDAAHEHAHDPAGREPHAKPRKPVKYRHPMNPKVFSDKPAKDSMGMDFIPVYEDEAPAEAGAAVPDRAAFTLSQERQQLIGVKSTPAARMEIVKTLRLPGRMGEGGAVYAQALEMDAGALRPGMKATVKAAEGPRLEARVTGVEGQLDAFSRTFGVALRLLEPAGPGMRPGVYCDVRVELKAARALGIPKDAVLDTGERQLVFVARDGGRFEPRELELGKEGDTHVEVLKGLKEGERVVSAANFLIDSESRFKAAAGQF